MFLWGGQGPGTSQDYIDLLETTTHTHSFLVSCPTHLDLHCQRQSQHLGGKLLPQVRETYSSERPTMPGELLVVYNDLIPMLQPFTGSFQVFANHWQVMAGCSVLRAFYEVVTGQALV